MTNRLKDSRLRRGWSQYDLERRSGVSQKSISNYERGVQQPSAAALAKLADALGVSTAYLLGSTNDTTKNGPVPSAWLEVVEEARAAGLTPGHLRAAIHLIEIARTIEPK